MLFRIVHELRGRLRLRCPRYSFALEQSAAIEEYFENLDFVTSCSASAASGGILLVYEPDKRDKLLALARALDVSALNLEETHQNRVAFKGLGRQLFDRLYGLTVRKVVMSLFVPRFIRWPMTIMHMGRFLKSACDSILKRKLDVHILDAAAILVSVVTGNIGQASNIMYLLEVAESMEDYTLQKSRYSVANALAMEADKVWVYGEEGQLREIPLFEVKAGDVLRVLAGSMIPLDGDVKRGEALVNQASMTGENEPVFKRTGMSVMSGTTITEGELDIVARSSFGDSRLRQIMRLLESTERNKAQAQLRAEAIADKLVPYSFGLFLALLVGTRSLTRAAAVLMVDYSCALRLALPVAIMTSMIQSSRCRIAVRGGRALESFAACDCIVFDKTGTITTARPEVADVVAMPGFSRDEVLRTAACIEEHFPHSLALAIVRKAREEGLSHEEFHAKVNYIVAHGVSTHIDGKEAMVGSYHFLFEDNDVTLSDEAKAILAEHEKGYSRVFLSIDGQLAGFVEIDEPIRPEAKDVIDGLRSLGIKHCVLLTGDREEAARRVADACGFDAFGANMLPEQKMAYVKRLQAEGYTVAMVGDGVNDSPALSQADVSVVMQDASDLARDIADVSILQTDLRGLFTLRQLSRELMGRLHSTYRRIVGFNSALLGAAAFNVMTPALVALAHNTSTLAFTGLAMRPYHNIRALEASHIEPEAHKPAEIILPEAEVVPDAETAEAADAAETGVQPEARPAAV